MVASLVAPLTPSLARTDLQLYGGAHAAKQPRLHTFFRPQTSKTTALVSSGELGATAVAIPGGEILVWVLNTTTNAPAAGATATLWARGSCSRCKASDVRQAATATADADGLVRFAAGVLGAHDSPALTVAAGTRRTPSCCSSTMCRGRDGRRRRAGPAGDRPRLYKEGDEVHVAGYLRSQDGAALALPPADSSGVACALESLIGTCVEYFVSVHWRHGRGQETKVGGTRAATVRSRSAACPRRRRLRLDGAATHAGRTQRRDGDTRLAQEYLPRDRRGHRRPAAADGEV